LIESRDDVEIRVGDTGTRATRDMILVNPTGTATGVLTLIDGRLEIRNPDDKTIEWMLSLATSLGARVVDNTRRTYRTPHERYIHPDDIAARRRLARKLRIAGNRMIPHTSTVVKWAFVGFFLLLGLVILFFQRRM
jgi:hypothetical protein